MVCDLAKLVMARGIEEGFKALKAVATEARLSVFEDRNYKCVGDGKFFNNV